MRRRRLLLSSIAVLVVACFSREDEPRNTDVSTDWSPQILAEHQQDLYVFLLSELKEPNKYANLDEPNGRIYLLTLTPMEQWGETGKWKDIPSEYILSHPNLKTWYRPAGDAYLKDGHVLTKDADKRAWMEWITIQRWISTTKAEVQVGVWCCPLGGGASTKTYEKVDGQWKVVDYGDSWVS